MHMAAKATTPMCIMGATLPHPRTLAPYPGPPHPWASRSMAGEHARTATRALHTGLMYSQWPSHLTPPAKQTSSSFSPLQKALNVPQQLYTCPRAQCAAQRIFMGD